MFFISTKLLIIFKGFNSLVWFIFYTRSGFVKSYIVICPLFVDEINYETSSDKFIDNMGEYVISFKFSWKLAKTYSFFRLWSLIIPSSPHVNNKFS